MFSFPKKAVKLWAVTGAVAVLGAMNARYLVAQVNALGQSLAELGEHSRATNDPVLIAQELLARPTDTTVTVNAAAAKDMDAYYEYGTKPGTYSGKTEIAKFAARTPVSVLIDKLQPNTMYYYRMRYRAAGSSDFQSRAEHTFHTQRPSGKIGRAHV